MKCQISKNELLRPLNLVCNTAQRVGSTTSLHLLLSVTPSGLFFTGSDLTSQTRVSLPIVSCSEPGHVGIPGKKLFDFCKMLPDFAVIELREENDRFIVSSGKSVLQLAKLSPEQLPLIEEGEALASVEVLTSGLMAITQGVAFSMANNDVRYFLNGLLLKLSKQGVETVTTDGHRLSYGKWETPLPLENPYALLIPRKSVLEIFKFLDYLPEETLYLSFGERTLSLSSSSALYTTQLLQGQFPEYKEALEAPLESRCRLSAQDLKQAVMRASVLLVTKPKKIKLSFSKSTLTLSMHNPSGEASTESLALFDYHGEEMDIGFDASYLLDILNNLKGQSVKIHFQDPGKQVRMFDPEDMMFRYLVMPLLF